MRMPFVANNYYIIELFWAWLLNFTIFFLNLEDNILVIEDMINN